MVEYLASHRASNLFAYAARSGKKFVARQGGSVATGIQIGKLRCERRNTDDRRNESDLAKKVLLRITRRSGGRYKVQQTGFHPGGSDQSSHDGGSRINAEKSLPV